MQRPAGDEMEPTVRFHGSHMARYYACACEKSIDWEKQHCVFKSYRNHRIDWTTDHRLPPMVEINYDRVLGIQKRRYFLPTLERLLPAPGLMDERRNNRICNPIDWGTAGVAVAARNTVYTIKVEDKKAEPQKLVTVGSGQGPGEGPVTGVAWAPNGHLIALGFRDCGAAVIHLWDAVCGQWAGDLLGEVGQHTVLSWRGFERNVITFGGSDGSIFCRDIRMPLFSSTGIVRSFHGGHREEVCALRWSRCGDRLASGDRDGVVCIWDIHMGGRWVHTFQDESRPLGAAGAVKALSWSSVHTHDLAASRGSRVCLLDSDHGFCFGDMDTGSELSGLAWGENETLFLTAHHASGQGKGLVYWRRRDRGLVRTLCQPSINSDVFFTAQSPDSSMMALGLVDSDTCEERVEIWKVFSGLTKRL